VEREGSKWGRFLTAIFKGIRKIQISSQMIEDTVKTVGSIRIAKKLSLKAINLYLDI
jgi:hypothetical protein